MKNGVAVNGMVVMPDFRVGRVRAITKDPNEMHKNGGNVEVEVVAGADKGRVVYMMGGYLEPLNHDTYRAHLALLAERRETLDRGMDALHHDTRITYPEKKNEPASPAAADN